MTDTALGFDVPAYLWQTEYRWPRPPKPHVMLMRGRWYIVDPLFGTDPPFGTWVQDTFPHPDPRPKP